MLRLIIFILLVSIPLSSFNQDSISVDAVTDIVLAVDSSVNDVNLIIDTIKEAPSGNKDFGFWLDLILITIMPLSVRIITRIARVQKRFNFLFKAFKSMDTLSIVIILSMIVAGITNIFVDSLPFGFDSIGDYFTLALTGSIAIYEATKAAFGRTPKVEEIQ